MPPEEGHKKANVASGAWDTGFWEGTPCSPSPRPMAAFAHSVYALRNQCGQGPWWPVAGFVLLELSCFEN